MGWFDNSQSNDQYNQYNDYAGQEEHKPKISHEVIGGAAAYEAAKAYEDHVAQNGQPDSHAKAKEIFAGFAGAFVDREVETRGLDFVDRERAKRHAADQFSQDAYDSYGN